MGYFLITALCLRQPTADELTKIGTVLTALGPRHFYLWGCAWILESRSNAVRIGKELESVFSCDDDQFVVAQIDPKMIAMLGTTPPPGFLPIQCFPVVRTPSPDENAA
jgi:hypothetical protein